MWIVQNKSFNAWDIVHAGDSAVSSDCALRSSSVFFCDSAELMDMSNSANDLKLENELKRQRLQAQVDLMTAKKVEREEAMRKEAAREEELREQRLREQAEEDRLRDLEATELRAELEEIDMARSIAGSVGESSGFETNSDIHLSDARGEIAELERRLEESESEKKVLLNDMQRKIQEVQRAVTAMLQNAAMLQKD